MSIMRTKTSETWPHQTTANICNGKIIFATAIDRKPTVSISGRNKFNIRMLSCHYLLMEFCKDLEEIIGEIVDERTSEINNELIKAKQLLQLREKNNGK